MVYVNNRPSWMIVTLRTYFDASQYHVGLSSPIFFRVTGYPGSAEDRRSVAADLFYWLASLSIVLKLP